MASPRFNVRNGRDVSRETILSEAISAALKTLNALDDIRYAATLAAMKSMGLPTAYTLNGTQPRNSTADLRLLEFAYEFVQSKLKGAGSSDAGALVTAGDASGDYYASRGELIRVDGTVDIVLPKANGLTNEGHQVQIKLMPGSVGMVHVRDAEGAQIDGAASYGPLVAGANMLYQHVSGPAGTARRGGIDIDLANLGAADEISINGTNYIETADFTDEATLAAAIDANEDELEAEVVTIGLNTFVRVQAVTPGRTNAELLADFQAVTITNVGGTIVATRVGGAALSPAAQFNVEGSDTAAHDEFLRGGAKIDIGGSVAGDTVDINGNTYTHGVDYTDAATLATAIGAVETALECEARGTVLVVQARVVGQDNFALLALAGALAASLTSGAVWTRVDSNALSPTLQLNAEGSERGGYYVVV